MSFKKWKDNKKRVTIMKKNHYNEKKNHYNEKESP